MSKPQPHDHSQLCRIEEEQGKQSALLKDVVKRVKALDKKIDSGNDPARLQTIVDKLKASETALAATIAATTPNEPLMSSQPLGEMNMPADLSALEAQVDANTDVEASAVLLLTNLSTMLAAAKNDPVQVQAIADKLKNSADALAAAIVANTPSA